MKKFMLLTIASAFTLMAVAQPPAGDAKPGEWYGAKVDASGAIAMSELPAMLEKNDNIDTKIKATVLDVCPKKGCWLSIAVNDSTTAFVKMKDYAFFLPVAAKGKTVVMDANIQMKTISVAEQQHYAEDAKKSREEIEAITQPKKEIRVLAKGITVVE